MTYRIVETDNFGGDYPDESFVNIDPIYKKEDAEAIAKAINAAFPEDHRRYWKVVEDSYELVPGFEP